jgi:hypothetical protein
VLVESQPPSRAGSWRALNIAGLRVGTLIFPVVDNFDISSPCRTPQRPLRPHTLPHLDRLVGAMLGYCHLGTISHMSFFTKFTTNDTHDTNGRPLVRTALNPISVNWARRSTRFVAVHITPAPVPTLAFCSYWIELFLFPWPSNVGVALDVFFQRRSRVRAIARWRTDANVFMDVSGLCSLGEGHIYLYSSNTCLPPSCSIYKHIPCLSVYRDSPSSTARPWYS